MPRNDKRSWNWRGKPIHFEYFGNAWMWYATWWKASEKNSQGASDLGIERLLVFRGLRLLRLVRALRCHGLWHAISDLCLWPFWWSCRSQTFIFSESVLVRMVNHFKIMWRFLVWIKGIGELLPVAQKIWGLKGLGGHSFHDLDEIKMRMTLGLPVLHFEPEWNISIFTTSYDIWGVPSLSPVISRVCCIRHPISDVCTARLPWMFAGLRFGLWAPYLWPDHHVHHGCLLELVVHWEKYWQRKIAYNEGVRHQTPQKCVSPKISWAVLKPTPEVDRNIQHALLNVGCLNSPHRGRSTQSRQGYGQGLPVLPVVPAETATLTTPTPISPTSAMTATTTGGPTVRDTINDNCNIDKNDNTRLPKDYKTPTKRPLQYY